MKFYIEKEKVMKKKSYLFYSFDSDRMGSSPLLDEEFDDAQEEDFEILQEIRTIISEDRTDDT